MGKRVKTNRNDAKPTGENELEIVLGPSVENVEILYHTELYITDVPLRMFEMVYQGNWINMYRFLFDLYFWPAL